MATSEPAEKMDDAERVARQLLDVRQDADAVYISGSLTAGLGNPRSDADVFLVAEADVERGTPQQHVTPSGRVDVEQVAFEELDLAVHTLLGIRLHRDNLSGIWMPKEQLDLALRFECRRSVYESARVQRLGSILAEKVSNVRRFLVVYWTRSVASFMEDYQGALLDDDHDTAALACQKMSTAAAKALAAGCGDFYLGEKWALRQLARSTRAFPLDRFREVQRGREHDRTTTIETVQEMVSAAQFLGWDQPGADRWPWRPPTGSSSDNGLTRVDDCLPFRLEEGVVLNRELVRQHVVPPGIAAIWALCGRRTRGEVVAAFEDLRPKFDLPFPSSISPEDAINGLLDRSLIREAA